MDQYNKLFSSINDISTKIWKSKVKLFALSQKVIWRRSGPFFAKLLNILILAELNTFSKDIFLLIASEIQDAIPNPTLENDFSEYPSSLQNLNLFSLTMETCEDEEKILFS